jgi:hypothetical protein
MLDGTYFFECACYSDEHVLKFVYDRKDREIYASIFLNDWQRWYKRLWIAIKYLFRYKCKYGHWDTWLMREEDLDKFISLFTTMKEDFKEANNNGLVQKSVT